MAKNAAGGCRFKYNVLIFQLGSTFNMIIYDGVYRLKSGKHQKHIPRAQWPYAWHIRIVNFNLSRPDIRHLKPRAVVAKQCGSKTCLVSCAESIGKRISRDFNLKVPQVMWIEHFETAPGKWMVASFESKSRFGPDVNYRIDWRPIRINEINAITAFIPEIDDF
jgi:hypothetical protein